jgi:acyl carrier protein
MSMSNSRTAAEETLAKFLVRANKVVELTPDLSLYADGIGLDSLETAELSSMLEDELGRDPFSEGSLPQTVGELLDFYTGEPQPQT